MVTSEPNLTKELLASWAEASKAIQNAKKSGVNTFDKYRYANLEDYLAAVKQPLADNGLILYAEMVGEPHFAERTTAKGNQETVCRVLVRTFVVHAESGGKVSADTWGEGQDRMDKAIYKAITGARKYGVAMLFGIYTTDDAEETRPPARKGSERPLVKPLLREQIVATINAETDPEKMGSYTARIAQRQGEGKLSDADAKACRAAVAQKTADLVSKAAAKGKLFDAAEKGAGVGV